MYYNMAGISFALYCINVLCIYIVGLLLFRMKGVVSVRKQLSSYKYLPPIFPRLGNAGDMSRVGEKVR